MTKKLSIVIVAILCIACSNKNADNKAMVKAYYDGFLKGDYGLVKQVMADEFISVEGDFTTRYTPETYHELFKWDSVFKPAYHIKEIKTMQNEVVATVSVSSDKFQFLKNNPLVFKHKFSFKNGKIARSEYIEFIGTDWDAWEAQKQALLIWIAKEHPELDGFMYDLTEKGAINYNRAMDLYKNRILNDSL
ncbi:hypothetical protein [Croceivirga sp. JEA036]|uniref:hypothetical protein n=1 Tax=Croceivirga sp. JEA036 TaxID=2721162 RepID=UPI001438B70C|nr:hypothetical protein [Croceivirga sp. JEA036]NJB36628.1 hypothetical protein [Croceivirga sp. JEA036]